VCLLGEDQSVLPHGGKRGCAQEGSRTKTRKQTSTPAAATSPEADTPSHRELTDCYNALVPAALALGITAVANSKVRPHTSDFFTKELGVRIIAAMEAAIAVAQAARPRD
jgi:hypothetical protein